MEVTEEQFIENLNAMPEEEQQVVLDLMDQVEMSDLETFAKALGVTVIGLEEETEQPAEGEEVSVTEEPAPTGPVVEEPVDTAAVEAIEGVPPAEPPSILPPPITPAPVPELPIDQEMQALALGDEVEDPEAEVVGPIAVPGTDTSGVADDVPMKGEEGDFILTAAAVENSGLVDIKKKLKTAIEAAEEDGLEFKLKNIIKPQKQIDGSIDYMASSGEIRIPKDLVKYIGLDVLEKMNAAVEEKTEEKLAEQEQKPEKENIPVRAA